MLFHEQGEYAKADAAWTRSFASSPAWDVDDAYDRALVKMALGQHDAAIAINADGLRRLPRNCRFWQQLGDVYSARGQPGDVNTALAVYEQGIAATPKCGLTYNAPARLLIAQGRPAEAKAKLYALIKIAPNSDGAVIAKQILTGIAAKP
jgi:tetratricopeptide (TPR) repeat protein